MFNKLKQFKDLRDQAKQLQNQLALETVTVEKNGNKLIMDGNQEVLNLILNPDATKEEQEKKLTELINEAIKKAQRIAAQKMQQMGGLNLPGM